MSDDGDLASALRRAAQHTDLIVVDSVTAAHQTRIANAAARLTTDSFAWVIFDTGPFGATYAKALGLSAQTNSRDTVLALIGSPTERSRLQANRLEEETDVSLITIAEPDVDVSEIVNTIEEQAHRGCPVVGIRTTTHEGTEASNPANAEEMLAFITELARTCASRLELGGIYASGGDVGVAVLASLGATGYAVESEILPLPSAEQWSVGPSTASDSPRRADWSADPRLPFSASTNCESDGERHKRSLPETRRETRFIHSIEKECR